MSGQQPFTTLLQGGLDVESPALAVTAGAAISCLNYEATKRGYASEQGFERYDGRALASAQVYSMLPFTGGDGFATGDEINGQTSGATATVLADAEISSGSYDYGDAAGRVPVLITAGTFADGENIRIGTTVVAICDGVAVAEDAEDYALSKSYSVAAWNVWRDMITEVPGSGPVRGVFMVNGALYAMRDNVGGTAGIMHKATAAGWVVQSFGSFIPFNTGTAAIPEGATITGPSGSAVVDRVINNVGTYGAGDAAGYLVVHSVTGTFSAGETVTGGGGSVKATAGATAITLPPGGRYTALEHNFYATVGTARVYVANGVGRAFEWDGAVLAPIWTGLPDALDKPTHIGQIAEHLLLGYATGTVQNSSIGTPLIFDALTGSMEFGLGEAVTNFISASLTVVIITGIKKVAYFSGTSADDFALKDITSESGALPWTAQQVAEPIFMDAAGIRGLSATNTAAGWALGTKTDQILKLIAAKADAGLYPLASVAVPLRAQYRVFYSDGTGISLYVGRQNAEPMTFDYGRTIECIWSSKASTGADVIYAGGGDGYVYRLFSGFSFDGDEIEAFVRIAYNSIKSPMFEKRFHGIECHVDSPGNIEIGVSAEFSYGSDEVVAADESSISVPGGGGVWDEAVWDKFVWSAASQSRLRAPLRGKGENISVAFMSASDREASHTLTSLTIMTTPRRMRRI